MNDPKVDMDNADVDGVKEQMLSAFGIDPDDVLPISAKTGMGCADVLSAVVDAVPPPRGGAGLAERNDDASRLADADADRSDAPLRALLLDCHYDPYRGAVSVVQIEDGTIRVGDSVAGMAQGGRGSEVLELGAFCGQRVRVCVCARARAQLCVVVSFRVQPPPVSSPVFQLIRHDDAGASEDAGTQSRARGVRHHRLQGRQVRDRGGHAV